MEKSAWFHRFIGEHNSEEFTEVVASAEVWGGEAKVFAHGLRVQAFPGRSKSISAYSFASDVPPKISYGMNTGGDRVVREVYWPEGAGGVLERKGGKFAAIPISCVSRWLRSND